MLLSPSTSFANSTHRSPPTMHFYDLEKDFCAHTIMSNLQQYCKPEYSRLKLHGVKQATYTTTKAHRCELCEENDDLFEGWHGWRHGVSQWGSSIAHRTAIEGFAYERSLGRRAISKNQISTVHSRSWIVVGAKSPMTPPPSNFERLVEGQGGFDRATEPSGMQKHTSRVHATPAERKRHLACFPLRNLLSKYRILDTISHIKPEVINDYLDIICAEPPNRPLAENLLSIYLSTPRPWLAIRGMISNFHTDVLHGILDILSDTIACTDFVLLHTSACPILTISEQEVASWITFECIRARRLVLSMLQQKIQAFVASLVRQSSPAVKPVTMNGLLPSPDPGQVDYYSSKPLPQRPAQMLCQSKTALTVPKSKKPSRRDSPFITLQRHAALTISKSAVAVAGVAVDSVVPNRESAANRSDALMTQFLHSVAVFVALSLPPFLSWGLSRSVIAIAEGTWQFHDAILSLLAGVLLVVSLVSIRRGRLSSVRAKLEDDFRCNPAATIMERLQTRHRWYSSISGLTRSIKLAIFRVSRDIGFVDPPLEDGEVRVKWRCVSL